MQELLSLQPASIGKQMNKSEELSSQDQSIALYLASFAQQLQDSILSGASRLSTTSPHLTSQDVLKAYFMYKGINPQDPQHSTQELQKVASMLATSNLTHYHLTDALLRRISLPSETMTVRMAGPHLSHGLNHKEVSLGVNEQGQSK